MRERSSLAIVGLFLAALPAWATGLTCRQDCTAGTCTQTACTVADPGTGSCRCGGRSIPWSEGVYATWCRSWSRPAAGAACGTAPDAAQVEEARTAAPDLGKPDLRLEDPQALLDLLAAKNPYVSTLLALLVEDGAWIEGPFEGQVHDSRFDEETAALAHSPALRVTGLVVAGGIGATQVELAIDGDLGVLAHLRGASLAAAPAAIAPAGLTGTVTDRGAHGSLVVTAAGGKSETVVW